MLAEIVAVGVIATLAMDLWQRFLQVIGVPSGSWGLIGRWVAGFLRGVLVNPQIAAAPKVSGEVAIGWTFHYAVGIAYAALYLGFMSLVLGSAPTLFSALLFAIALLVAPWLVMQPALGMGVMASRTPKPAAVRAVNISVHTVFGLGLYLGVLVWSAAFNPP